MVTLLALLTEWPLRVLDCHHFAESTVHGIRSYTVRTEISPLGVECLLESNGSIVVSQGYTTYPTALAVLGLLACLMTTSLIGLRLRKPPRQDGRLKGP